MVGRDVRTQEMFQMSGCDSSFSQNWEGPDRGVGPWCQTELDGCLNSQPSAAPTVSAAPSASSAPSQAPSVSAAPSRSLAPSQVPSRSMSPSRSSAPTHINCAPGIRRKHSKSKYEEGEGWNVEVYCDTPAPTSAPTF